MKTSKKDQLKLPRGFRKSTVVAGAGAATLMMALFIVSPHAAASATAAPTKHGASARVATALTNWLGCARPLVPPRNMPASLKGWYSSQNNYITRRIGLDQRALAREGVELTMWGPDPCSGKIKIYLTHYSRAAARILITAYGNDIIVSHRSMPRPPLASRSNDQSPFSGGDFLLVPHSDGTYEGCSGGPIVEVNGTTAALMLTAGHCGNGIDLLVYRSDRSLNFGPAVGKLNQVRLCNKCIDSATIRHDSTGADYVYSVWGGGDSSSTSYLEDSTAFPQPFNLVTQDSAYTGELTGLVVEDVNQTITFSDGITRVELTLVHGGQQIIQSGDSGGPWLQHLGSTNEVSIVGTTVGGGGEFAYYQQIDSINDFFGVHVPTQ
jgi:hypothetical protein